jgi:hypothetical protein
VTLTGASLGGAQAGNYTLTSVGTTTANITARQLTITATGVNKVYDGTTTATVTLSDNRVPDDVFTTSYTTATFSDKNIGIDKVVSVTGITKSGKDADNYTANTTASTTANITALCITVTPTGTPQKQYSDADPVFTYTYSPALAAGDAFTGSLGRNAGEAPGVYPITIGNLALSTNYTLKLNTTPVRLQITEEDAIADYTGAEFASTGTATATSGKLRLSATLTDTADALRGEIINARVRFKIVPMTANMTAEPAVYTSWRYVTLITSDKTVGTAVLDTALSVGNLNAKNFDIYVQVGGYYRNFDSAVVKSTVTVSKSLNDYITGGGNIKFGALTANKSAGVYKSNDNSKTNFGFNVKYSKTGNNLQGNVNVIIRSGNNVYQVKGVVGGSNGILGTDVRNTKSKKATLTAKASMFNTLTGLPVPNGSSATLRMDMIDKAEPGANIDSLAISVVGADGTLLYAITWINNTSVGVPISGGNIQVNSSTATTTSTTQTVTLNQAVQMSEVVQEAADTKFGLSAFPNPSRNQFSVHLESSDRNSRITLRVFDISGRTVGVIPNLMPGQTIQLGNEYRPGIYFVEMIQGKNRTQVKLLKAVN